ncbi:MAG: ribonuclease PH [Alphaproteobacteria bacterium]
MRADNRANDALRPISIEMNVNRYAEGSCLIKAGNTHVLCTASLEERVPPWMRGSNEGWVTAEYAMLPRATHDRGRRERKGASGRTQEIQRLIGRSLRAVVDMKGLGERQISLDCDVLQADGGTRTASITGAYVALYDCLRFMKEQGMIDTIPLKTEVAAISVGLHQGEAKLDLDYSEDSSAEADANFVLTGNGGIVEIQGTAEQDPFSEEQFGDLLRYAKKGVAELVAIQRQVLGLS